MSKMLLNNFLGKEILKIDIWQPFWNSENKYIFHWIIVIWIV